MRTCTRARAHTTAPTQTHIYTRSHVHITPVYDVTRRETFEDLERIWMKEVDIYSNIEDAVKMVVANKVDLVRVGMEAASFACAWQRQVQVGDAVCWDMLACICRCSPSRRHPAAVSAATPACKPTPPLGLGARRHHRGGPRLCSGQRLPLRGDFGKGQHRGGAGV